MKSPQSLTLRQAYDRFYDRAGLSRTWLHQLEIALSLWEQHTKNPAIAEASNLDMEALRNGYAPKAKPRTVNNTMTILRTVFRRLAIPTDGNPSGLGIIKRPPWARSLRVEKPLPKRIPLEDLSKVYIAAGCATAPKAYGAPAREFWRCALVLAYCTGLRRSDLAMLRREQIEPEGLRFKAKKTGKHDLMFLREEVREHIARVGTDPILGKFLLWGKDYRLQWRKILRRAKVEPFDLHDIRRTASSEVERVKAGMARYFLQHAPRNVTEASYLNMTAELAECIQQMRIPGAFRHGPVLQDRAEKERRKEAALHPSRFRLPFIPTSADFAFGEAGHQQQAFCFRGKWYVTRPRTLQLIRVLVEFGRPASIDEITEAWGCKRGALQSRISEVRMTLREALYLPPDWNPIPYRSINGTAHYWLYLPPDVLEC